jgi:hypothetical protein
MLFGQSSGSTVGGANTEADVRRAAMAFFVSCMVLVDQVDGLDDMVWQKRVDLLEIVNKETLFRSTEVRLGDDAEAVLRKSRDVAIEAVASASQGWSSLCATLFRIDFPFFICR